MTSPAALLRALDKRLTPGPWTAFGPYSEGGWLDGGYLLESWADDHGYNPDTGQREGGQPLWCASQGMQQGDAETLAALRNALPELAAVLELASSVPAAYPEDAVTLHKLDAALSALTEKLDV